MRSLDIEYIFGLIYRFFTGHLLADWWERFVGYLVLLLPGMRAFGVFVALFAFTGILYALIRTHQVRVGEKEALDAAVKAFSPADTEGGNPRWKHVVALGDSTNPNDWRLAIIEADIILDEVIRGMGYEGEDMGERLKRIEKNALSNLDAAWEAHKVRNRIAHSGSDYIFTQREARRVIDLYRRVFEELHYI